MDNSDYIFAIIINPKTMSEDIYKLKFTGEQIDEILSQSEMTKAQLETTKAQLDELGDKVERGQLALGHYNDFAPIELTAIEGGEGFVVNANGTKETKAGWAMARFTAEKGNEYLFKPNITDGSVAIFAEEITRNEARMIDYVDTYNEDGTMKTSKATYNGTTYLYVYNYAEVEGETGATRQLISITETKSGEENGVQQVDALPTRYITNIGTYQPLTILNNAAQLPTDGYCRFISHFKGNAAINVIVSFNIAEADRTMLVLRDGAFANLSTQLGSMSTKIDRLQADKQEKLIDGVTIRTINGQSLLGAGDIAITSKEDAVWYGIEKDDTISTSACTRIASDMSLHRKLPIHSKMRGCLLNDNGEVVKYLNPTSWEEETRDGSQGQVMVEIPSFYYTFEREGNIWRIKISESAISGWTKTPKLYVGAYQAALQRSTLKLASVRNVTTDYRGGNNNASYDGTYRSLLGMPATNISRANFRTYARKRKADSTEWNCHLYEAHKLLTFLYWIEYADLNVQADFNAELTTEGYKQGGLGKGVTDFANWSEHNGANPIIPCGASDSLGNGSGFVDFVVAKASGSQTMQIPRYRGIENPFGHVWHWTDGINFRIGADESNGGTGLSEVFVCYNPAYFDDADFSHYTHVGNEARANGYCMKMIDGEIIEEKVGGGSNTYYCDYHYGNIPTSGSANRGLLLGGSAVDGANAGLVYTYSHASAAAASANFGSRLCFKPQNENA